MKTSNFGVLIGVIGIVAMLVIPLPPVLLDFLLIINLSLSLMILLISMNTDEALKFSVFPSLLLLTTLFRLALNVSSTRLILGNGQAGNVIAAFGNFVIAGNAVVGFIVFLILAIIQFIVITRGAERVAEVAARFTLDAMPGKQMAIDADLNTGLINEKEARERRKNIEREADFYGAMDGASKFVKGDAVASIIIVVINIVGGFIMGAMKGSGSITDILHQYTLLSVGDGLVSQIPALLISTATGIIVTRAASESSLSQDVLEQLTTYPKMLYIVAGALVTLSLFTPIQIWKTLPIALLLSYAAYRIDGLHKDRSREKQETITQQEQAEIRSPESVVSLTHVDPIEFEFGYALIPLADVSQGGDLLDRVIMIRRQIALELGVVVPVIRIRDNIQLKPNEYVIKIKGNEVAHGELLLDHFLAMSPGFDDPSIMGIQTVEPAFGLPALWVSEETRENAEYAGYTVVDPPSVVATHLTEVIKKHLHELLGRQDTKSLLDSLRNNYPSLVDELVPGMFTLGEVQRVLVNLLKEKVSIRDLVSILETMADSHTYTKDPDLITEYVRAALARQISSQYKSRENSMKVITLAQPIEQRMAEAIQNSEQGAYMALDPRVSQQVYQALSDQVQAVTATGHQPVVLASPNVRMHLRRLIERVLPDIPVLSYNELDPTIEIQSGGVVNI